MGSAAIRKSLWTTVVALSGGMRFASPALPEGLGHAQQLGHETGALVQRAGAGVAGKHPERQELAAVRARPCFGMCEQGAADAAAILTGRHRKIGDMAGARAAKEIALHLQVQEADPFPAAFFCHEEMIAGRGI